MTHSLFTALSTMATHGAGFTLSVVVLSPSGSNDSTYKRFQPKTMTIFVAISSILFVLTALVSQGCAQLFRFEQICIAEGVDNNEPLVLWSLANLSLLLQVLAAHETVVGFVGIALTTCLGIVALVLWGLQTTGRKPVAQ